MRKKYCFLSLIPILVVLAACTGQNESNESAAPPVSASEPIKTSDETNEISVTDAKKYLRDNFGNLNIDGSTSMVPLHQALRDLFVPNNEITVEHRRTADAFERFIIGDNDILLGVDYSDELLEKAKNSGIELVKKEITKEAFVFLININNPVKTLTTSQLKDIYSGKITNWSQVGGDDAPINAFQRNNDSGSQMRMVKFMGDTKLMEQGVEYYSGMGSVVEVIASYDEGKYSMAYNMYTFTEKQYPNDEVVLLNVNGVRPDDVTIFDETYPIVIRNYIYYDKNNALASEFVENLYVYLMSDEGKKLISESGYVNINALLHRNTNVEVPYNYDDSGIETYIGFYNGEKGEFYDTDNNNNLLIFTNYTDYVLRDTSYSNDIKARAFLTYVYNSDIELNYSTAWLREDSGSIMIFPWSDGSLDPEDFFNFMYDGKYYSNFTYYIDENKYILETYSDQETFDNYLENGYLDGFSDYTKGYEINTSLEITEDDLSNLYLRTINYAMPQEVVKLEFYQPFNTATG